MSEPSRHSITIEHGEQCSCKLLALATGLDPRALSFEYCQRVLQKRWRMTCCHGRPASEPASGGPSERWRDVGPIDSVKAILLSNEPGQD